MLHEVLLPTSTADFTVVQPADTLVSTRVPKVGANIWMVGKRRCPLPDVHVQFVFSTSMSTST